MQRLFQGVSQKEKRPRIVSGARVGLDLLVSSCSFCIKLPGLIRHAGGCLAAPLARNVVANVSGMNT